MSQRWRATLGLLTALLFMGSNGHTARIIATSSTGSAAPSSPVVGYAAWFKSAEFVFSDAGCSAAQSTDGGDVACWQSSGGSYGALSVKVPGGYGAPAFEENEFNGYPAIRSQAASFELLRDGALDMAVFEGGLLSVGSGTAFAVVKLSTINGTNRMAWGDGNGYVAHILVDSSGDSAVSFLYDGASKTAAKPATESATLILTWHHEGGALYSGVNDTRTSSMSTASAGNMDTASGYVVLLGGSGPGAYLDGDAAEYLFYPTALSEASRMLVERYLAAKYAVTLPY